MSHVSFHVLIVEDDDAAGELVKTILVTQGHRVEVVASGRAALARLAVSPLPDVVLLDVMMPEMGGIETLRRYRQAGGAVPVVMVSGLDEPQTETEIECLRQHLKTGAPFGDPNWVESLELAAGTAAARRRATRYAPTDSSIVVRVDDGFEKLI